MKNTHIPYVGHIPYILHIPHLEHVLYLQILTSLGPVEELLRGNDGGHADNGNGEPPDVGGLIGGAEDVQTEAFFAGAVSIDGDDLSCGRMLLAAARTFASHKIQALVSDVQTVARQLR